MEYNYFKCRHCGDEINTKICPNCHGNNEPIIVTMEHLIAENEFLNAKNAHLESQSNEWRTLAQEAIDYVQQLSADLRNTNPKHNDLDVKL